MKFKATKKQMRDNYYRIISIPYCKAQHLLNYENPIAYSSSSEGWACDYYDINGVLISTGYSYIDSKNTNCNYNMLREYEIKAEKIQYNNSIQNQKEQIKELLEQFVKECITK